MHHTSYANKSPKFHTWKPKFKPSKHKNMNSIAPSAAYTRPEPECLFDMTRTLLSWWLEVAWHFVTRDTRDAAVIVMMMANGDAWTLELWLPGTNTWHTNTGHAHCSHRAFTITRYQQRSHNSYDNLFNNNSDSVNSKSLLWLVTSHNAQEARTYSGLSD